MISPYTNYMDNPEPNMKATYTCKCGKTFTQKDKRKKRCQDCSLKKPSYFDKRNKNPGIGSGRANKFGPQDSQYKTGIRYFHRVSRTFKETKRYCERCNKDLLGVGRYFWCVHHKDHNRGNNLDSNFELLCKSCHQKEHKCWEAFGKGATTSSQSVEDRVFEKHGTLK